MSDPSQAIERIRRGVDAPPPARVEVAAGRVQAVLDGVDVRSIRVGRQVLIDRIYVALRDRDWNTIPAQISDLRVETSDAGFSVTFAARHRSGDIDFGWQGSIEGAPDGQIRYAMSGTAASRFLYCRIGFCVLHPDTLTGARYSAGTPEGLVSGRLPELVASQEIVDGFERPLFPAFDALELEGPRGLLVRAEFEGDLFEMEDQRNWTDASFKTYCTPIALGYPYEAQPGQRIEQSVVIRIEGEGTAVEAGDRPAAEAGDRPAAEDGARPAADALAQLTIGGSTGRTLPDLGFGMASGGIDGGAAGLLSAREQELLRALQPDHLRVDVRPSQPDWEAPLDVAIENARLLETALEVALFVPSSGAPGPDLAAVDAVADRLAGANVRRWLVFDEATAGTGTTPGWLIAAVAERLRDAAPGAQLAGGTDGDFAELNRGRPPLDGLDALTYAVNPQVHASDDTSLMENVTAQGATVRTARSYADGRAIVVSPVTLAARFNPAAAGPDERASSDKLPPAVDPRQVSLLGAAWTVGSVASLAAAGVASVTYYETVGWRGLIERETGSPLPERFLSRPGMVFPLYHVFADLAEMRGAELLAVESSAPRSVVGLAVRREDRLHGLIANLTPTALPVAVGRLSGPVPHRVLDETTAAMATTDADAFRRFGTSETSDDDHWRLTLRPYAVVVFGASSAT